ncbi:MAG: 50S ribosomal protein L6 [Pseudomonadota bacterium]|nr:50S ribosomal protein L6 [Pseudomonadota bacterium]
MSRIGKLPVTLPSGVSVNVADGVVRVKGPNGELSQRVAAGVTIEQDGSILTVVRADDSRQFRSNHGLTRALVNNMVQGVTKGFERRLEIQGVGFKSEVKGKTLVLSLGYSHTIEFPFPTGITIAVEKGTKLSIKGSDRQIVGETAAKLRGFRSPDAYKGKGVRNEGEHIKLKAGKTAKK